jgi:hypothetical protein
MKWFVFLLPTLVSKKLTPLISIPMSNSVPVAGEGWLRVHHRGPGLSQFLLLLRECSDNTGQFGSYRDHLPSAPYCPWQTVAYAEGERSTALTALLGTPNYLQLRRLHCVSPKIAGESRLLLRMCTRTTRLQSRRRTQRGRQPRGQVTRCCATPLSTGSTRPLSCDATAHNMPPGRSSR